MSKTRTLLTRTGRIESMKRASYREAYERYPLTEIAIRISDGGKPLTVALSGKEESTMMAAIENSLDVDLVVSLEVSDVSIMDRIEILEAQLADLRRMVTR